MKRPLEASIPDSSFPSIRTAFLKNTPCRTAQHYLRISQNANSGVLSGLLLLDYYNKIPQTRYLKKNRNLFLTILEARSLRSRCQLIQYLVGAHFLVHRLHLVAIISHGGDSKGVFLGLFYKGTNPIYESSILMT